MSFNVSVNNVVSNVVNEFQDSVEKISTLGDKLGINAQDACKHTSCQEFGGMAPPTSTKSTEAASFDFSNALNSSGDIAKLMFILQTLFQESRATDAMCAISEMISNMESLLNQAEICIDKATTAKKESDTAADWKMAAACFTMAAGVLSLAATGITTKVTDFASAANSGISTGVSSTVSGAGGMVGARGELEANEAELTRQESTAEQKEMDAEANRASADKQRAEMWENHWNQLVQELAQLADKLLAEMPAAMRAVGRNI